MSANHGTGIKVTLHRDAGYRMLVRFHHGRIPDLFTDEPPPLGAGSDPGPQELLAAAIGSCLASSLMFCMQKARLDVRDLEAEVAIETGRHGDGRLRVTNVDVRLSPTVTPEVRAQMGRCVEIFESFCSVTQSVRAGFPVNVSLAPHEVAAEPPVREST